MRYRIQFWSLSLILLAIGVTPGLAADPVDQERLKLKAAVDNAKDPISKAKSLARLADLEWKQAIQESRAGDLEKTDQALIAYADLIRQAHSIFKAEHEKAPKKNLSKFREFDILLGHHLKRLNDIKNSYPFDQQEKINEAIRTAEHAKQDMLSFIFGEENVLGTGEPKKSPDQK